MRVALITGGAGGLGLATAKRFARDGMTVALTDVDGARAQEAVAELTGQGHRGWALDVSSEDAVIAVFDSVERERGGISVLAHFAGTIGAGGWAVGSSLINATVEDWDGVLAINARGTFLCVREMARRRRAVPLEHGRIILVSSISAQQGGGRSGPAYSASKAAVLGLMRTAARDLAPFSITVNAIAPGPIDTPMLAQAQGGSFTMLNMVPLQRIGTPDEIAEAASFLASVGAGFITGATIDINGGLLMR